MAVPRFVAGVCSERAARSVEIKEFLAAQCLDEVWCGRGDSNPHRHCCPTDFLTSYGFRRLAPCRRVCGLDYPFTVLWPGRRAPLEGRCCPSSLYTFPLKDGRAWTTHRGLGSGLPWNKVSPTLGSSASGVSPGALKSYLKSVASTGFATPA